MKKIIIAIDGTSSSGKSSFARQIAARLGYTYVDTGAMYRAVALWAMRHGMIADDGTVDDAALNAALPGIGIAFRPATNHVCLDGEDVERQIRTIGVSRHVSAVSRIPAVRQWLVGIQQRIGADKGVVMDGRDIGTVVFPDAELKIFMTADPEVRARRRYNELTAKGEHVSLEEITENIRQRDRADMERPVSPLRMAPDALLLDNSHMSIDEQMTWAEGKIGELGIM
jgi:cytidylate kinase